MSSNRFVVCASLTVKPQVKLLDVWRAMEPFAKRFSLELGCDSAELPDHGEMPFAGENVDSYLELGPEGRLSFDLECWAFGAGFMPDEAEGFCENLAGLVATGGTVQIIDTDASPSNDDARAFRCIGATPQLAAIARAEHGMDLARDALLGVMDKAAFEQLREMAKKLAEGSAATTEGRVA